jgi:TolB-like protein/Flp pilus assembly protein TadD
MPAARFLEFGPFRLDVRARLLFRAGERMPLPPKAADVLVALVEKRGRAVGREELLRQVWAGTTVEEGSLTSHVSLLRRVLGEVPGGAPYIETIPKRGYRFLATVEEIEPAGTIAPADRPVLAVLPFENLDGGPQDYFSDGLTEEAITHIGRLAPERLGVIARSSVARYKQTSKSIREIGEELAVSHILEGSVRRSGNRVRIAAQLIQVSDQTHLWAESYDRDLGDLLNLEDELARAIAKQIEVKLAPAPTAPARTLDADAYEAYLRGRHFWNRRTLESIRRSIECFESSTRREPRYADAHSGLADSYMSLHDGEYLVPAEARARAREAAETAVAIAPGLAEAHSSLAHVLFHEFDWTGAEREFREAIALNANYGTARFYNANYLVAFGRFDEAIVEGRAALRLDPVSLPAGANMARIYFHAGHAEEAIEHCRRVLEIEPGFVAALEQLGYVLERRGRHAEAISAFSEAVQGSKRAPRYLSCLAYAHASAGHRKQARELLREIEKASRERYVCPYALALVHAGLGEPDAAFRRLEQALEQKAPQMPFVNVIPQLESLRPDARFPTLVSRMGLAPRQDSGREGSSK